MSSKRVYHTETLLVEERFFAALEACIATGIVRSEAGFCAAHGLDRRSLWTQRHDHGRGYFQPSWLVWLVLDGGVSADWLLTGRGRMFER